MYMPTRDRKCSRSSMAAAMISGSGRGMLDNW
jgi:hypothetical protein